MPKRQEFVKEYIDSYQTMVKAWKVQFLEEIAHEDVTPTLARIMFLLKQTGSIQSKDIAQHMHVTRGAASQFVDLLDGRGYIKKSTDKTDRRIVHLSLTDKGRARAQELELLKIKLAEKFTKELTTSELESLVLLNRKIVTTLTK